MLSRPIAMLNGSQSKHTDVPVCAGFVDLHLRNGVVNPWPNFGSAGVIQQLGMRGKPAPHDLHFDLRIGFEIVTPCRMPVLTHGAGHDQKIAVLLEACEMDGSRLARMPPDRSQGQHRHGRRSHRGEATVGFAKDDRINARKDRADEPCRHRVRGEPNNSGVRASHTLNQSLSRALDSRLLAFRGNSGCRVMAAFFVWLTFSVVGDCDLCQFCEACVAVRDAVAAAKFAQPVTVIGCPARPNRFREQWYLRTFCSPKRSGAGRAGS